MPIGQCHLVKKKSTTKKNPHPFSIEMDGGSFYCPLIEIQIVAKNNLVKINQLMGRYVKCLRNLKKCRQRYCLVNAGSFNIANIANIAIS